MWNGYDSHHVVLERSTFFLSCQAKAEQSQAKLQMDKKEYWSSGIKFIKMDTGRYAKGLLTTNRHYKYITNFAVKWYSISLCITERITVYYNYVQRITEVLPWITEQITLKSNTRYKLTVRMPWILTDFKYGSTCSRKWVLIWRTVREWKLPTKLVDVNSDKQYFITHKYWAFFK